MWRGFSDWIHRVSTGWVALTALVIFALFAAFVLPGQAANAGADGSDVGSPDLSFYYTAQDLYRMAEAYGEQGRQDYVRVRFTFDLIWPLVYTVFLATGTSWVYRRAFAAEALWQRANIVPVLGALLDFLENVSTSVVMIRYPSPTAIVDMLAPVLTMVKWVLVSTSFVLLVVGVVAGIFRWMRARGTQ
jgi:hypothetical protein